MTAEGIAVETGLDVESLETRGDLAWLVGANERKAGPFDLVVDASGSRSRLKAFCLQPSEPKPLLYGAFWASLQADTAAQTST
uniref:hypothetical protein n=1 Tax=Pseudomonas viridiflava TaxID=33069 RepID=UPI0019817993